MNGILLLAAGNEMYAKMAVVCAASIKKKNPEIPIAILHSKKILDKLSKRQRDLFDQTIEVDIHKRGANYTVMEIKTRLYELSPFDNTLFLDADTIVCPSSSIALYFDELKYLDFVPFNSGYNDDKVETDESYPVWAMPEALRKIYGIGSDIKIPRINSGFLSFRKTKKAKQIFELANQVFHDKNKFQEWRGEKPDEVCFNVACAVLDYELHQYPFEPVFLYFKHKERSREYVIDNYPMMSSIGKDVKDPAVIGMYNDFMNYYFDYHGFSERFYYQSKEPLKRKKLYGYWHICMIKNFLAISGEQLKLMVSSGLYDKVDIIKVGCVGDFCNVVALKKLFKKYPKIEISVHAHSIAEYEFPTIRLIKEDAKKEQPFNCFYIHSKGVANPAGTHWRNYLNHYNITHWKKCQAKLKEGYDIVGVKFMGENHAHPQHFSGNFWHTTSDYIRRLPEIDLLDTQNRYNAEFWSGMSRPKWFSLNQTIIDHVRKPAFV